MTDHSLSGKCHQPVVTEVPTASGDGLVLFSQLELRDRVLRSGDNYDPVAERILVNVISK